jgi:hypothetical protein
MYEDPDPGGPKTLVKIKQLCNKKGKLYCTCNFSGSFCPFMVVISSGSERICFARVP